MVETTCWQPLRLLCKFHVNIEMLEYSEECLKDEVVDNGCFKRPAGKSTCCLTDEVMYATVHTVPNQVISVMILNF